jgi:hypothetical protein
LARDPEDRVRAPGPRSKRDPVSVEDQWAPVSAHGPPVAFRRRWLAAVVSLAVLVGVLLLI